MVRHVQGRDDGIHRPGPEYGNSAAAGHKRLLVHSSDTELQLLQVQPVQT